MLLFFMKISIAKSHATEDNSFSSSARVFGSFIEWLNPNGT
jgi:hypothetical protein